MSPYDTDTYLKMTGDDLRATRVLSLAVKFFGTRKPIASSSIAVDLYPNLDSSAFRRQYLRDRELLSTFGMVIREVGEDAGDTLWQVDESASYVQGEGIPPEAARELYVLCHDMVYDPSFAYRDELRMALAKISQMYRGASVSRSDRTTSSERKILSALVAGMGDRHAVEVAYTDAHGVSSTRKLALLGTFGLHGRSYFVASRVEPTGELVPDSVRIYRLDRFTKVRELKNCRYKVPQDFCVNDYERLPFQIGDEQGMATFAVPAEPVRELQRAMASSGTVQPAEDGAECVMRWTVPYSDAHMAASWGIATGAVPVEPAELVVAWEQVRAQTAASQPYDYSLAHAATMHSQEAKHHKTAGRTGSVTVARQLVALASSLTREGRVITARDIANTLGVEYDYARHLITLVSMTGGESFDYLPVVLSDDDDEVSLMEGALLSARRVRLTRSETIAMQAALTELGVGSDDPLAQTLVASFAAPTFSLDDIARSLEAPSSASDGPALRLCSEAITAGRGLEFDYVPVSGGERAHRRVQPLLVRRSDDSWYLDAYDLVRQADRVFRIDRMSNVAEVPLEPSSAGEKRRSDEQYVVVRFNDPRYLEVFAWDRLEVLESDADSVIVRLPQYAGTWLARHLASCAGTVQVSSEELAQQILDQV